MSRRFSSYCEKAIEGALIAAPIGLVIAGLAGWVMNIVALWNTAALNGATLLRVIGIPIWPIGAIIRWLR